jgi:hypothetical protein
METYQMIPYRKEVYGKVKNAVIEGHAAGLTYAEVVAKYGVRLESLYSAAKRLGLTLKPSKHTK